MRQSHLPLLGLLLLAACGKGLLMSTTAAVTPSAPDDAVTCTREKLKELGYRQRAYDEADRRVLAEKDDPTLKVATPLFRKTFHRIEVTIRPDASGNTTFDTKLQTFREYTSQQGQTFEEIRVPASALDDQRRLIEACAPAAP